MLGSAKWLYSIFTILSILIIIKIIVIQVGTSGDELRSMGEQYSFRSERIEAVRGNILADDQRILSTSIPYYELRMDFATPGMESEFFESNVGALAASLSTFFGDTTAAAYETDLREARTERKRYHRIAPRRVNFVELQQIKTFPIICEGVRKSGFIAESTYRRMRPYGDLAMRTIGFVNASGTKLGIEGSFDDGLNGLAGLTVKQKISGSFWIPIQSRLNIDPVDGMDVKTTINIEIQSIVQSELHSRIQEIEADWGTAIVMEVATGHIKAIANVTRKRNGELVEDYNYAVGMSQEPGSTFKLPVLMTLLDDGKISLDDKFDTEGGTVMIGRARVTDVRRGGHGVITLREIFEQSSNIGMAKAVEKVYSEDESRFVDEILDFGFDKNSGLHVSGEPHPTIKHPRVRGSGWDGTSMTMMSYGYALRVTPLQTLTLYNAVANGGRMMRPMLVSELQRKGETVKTFPTEVIKEQIATPETIREVQHALESVVKNGTARSLQNPYFSSAAKTGTAQIAIGRSGYKTADGSRHYLGSVAGYFPADNPKYSIIVAFKTFYKAGSGRAYYGGQLAAPLFKSISERIYNSSYEFLTPYSGNDNFAPQEHKEHAIVAEEVDSLGIPNVMGMSFDDALSALEQRGFDVHSSGVGKVSNVEPIVDSVGQVHHINITLSNKKSAKKSPPKK